MNKPAYRRNTSLILLIIGLIAVLMAKVNHTVQAGYVAKQQEDAAQAEDPVTIYFFWGNGCPHCAQAGIYFGELQQQYPRLEVQAFEVWYNEENAALMGQVATGFGFEPQFVPTIFIGDKYWTGYSEDIAVEIKNTIDQYMVTGDTNKAAQFLNGVTGTGLPQEEVIPVSPASTSTPTQNVEPTPTPEVAETETPASQREVNIPLIGRVDLSHQSALVTTLIIALVDGFNPCSIWVLSMLLSITLHSGSRKKVLLIGLVFLTVTAAVYALFISGLFTIFKVVRFMGWIQVVVALVALFFALVNIKDYFWYKEGLSFTIDDKNKPGIYKNIRRVMDAGDSFWGLVGGTVVLALGVSLVEFACTAGFPVMWTNLLNAQNVTNLTFVLLLILYMLIYQLDELGLFLVAVFSLKANKVEEKHGRILKLIGGVLMLSLAVVMLVKPSIMSNLNESLLVFGIAFGATLLILLVHRVILPRMGVRIGSELGGKKKKKRK